MVGKKNNNTHLKRFNTTPLCYKHSLLLLPHRGLGRPDPRTTSRFSLKWLYLSICETQVPSVTCYILQARQTMPWGQINLHDLRFISCSLCLSRKGQRGVSHPHVTETSLTGCCCPVAALSGTHPPPQCQGWSRAKNLEGHSPDFKSFCTEGTHFFLTARVDSPSCQRRETGEGMALWRAVTASSTLVNTQPRLSPGNLLIQPLAFGCLGEQLYPRSQGEI